MKQTAGSWLLVRFARGGETKARPSQLRALRADEALSADERAALAAPFDAVRDVQDAIDADVRVASSDGGFLPNAYVDKGGERRLQFVAYKLDGDNGGVGVRCDVCDLEQVLPESAVADGSRGKIVHALKSHCGYYAACSMSASNAHIAALQDRVAETLRRGMPGDHLSSAQAAAQSKFGGSWAGALADAAPRAKAVAPPGSPGKNGRKRPLVRPTAQRCGACGACRAKKGAPCAERGFSGAPPSPAADDRPPPKASKKAPKVAPARKPVGKGAKEAPPPPPLPDAGYESAASDVSSTLGWVVQVPPWDEAARDAYLANPPRASSNDFYERIWEPYPGDDAHLAAARGSAALKSGERLDDVALSRALAARQNDPDAAGARCREALDALAKRRGGSGFGDHGWVKGSSGALSAKEKDKAKGLFGDDPAEPGALAELRSDVKTVAKALCRSPGDVLSFYYAQYEPDKAIDLSPDPKKTKEAMGISFSSWLKTGPSKHEAEGDAPPPRLDVDDAILAKAMEAAGDRKPTVKVARKPRAAADVEAEPPADDPAAEKPRTARNASRSSCGSTPRSSRTRRATSSARRRRRPAGRCSCRRSRPPRGRRRRAAATCRGASRAREARSSRSARSRTARGSGTRRGPRSRWSARRRGSRA